MHVAQFNSHTLPSFYNSNVVRLIDIAYAESCVVISNCFNKDSFAIFSQSYNLYSNIHT